MPFGKWANNGGFRFRFDRRSLQLGDDLSRNKLLRDHGYSDSVGYLIEARELEDGSTFAKYQLGSSPEADAALRDANEKTKDGFSVGVDFDLAADTVPDPEDPGALLVRRADWRETSLTAMPAFDDARVTSVAASRANGGSMHTCATCGATLTPG